MPALYDLLQMIPVEPGTFTMGSPKSEYGRDNDEKQVKVSLTKDFSLGRFPVTNLVWHLIMDEELQGAPYLPKVNVSWFDAAYFCQKLNELLGLPQAMTVSEGAWSINFDSSGFRLPTEAEWEYCCRAGTLESTYGPIDEIAWTRENSGHSIQPVGLKLPNSWDFYDMLGNVWEWCWNWHKRNLQDGIDPIGPNTGYFRGCRGGSWSSYAQFVRNYGVPGDRRIDLGFRPARTLEAAIVSEF